MARLKAQEEKFCQIYTADIKRNGTKAAIEAGYSEKGASVQASRMLRRANIIARVRELEREAAHAAVDDPEKLRLHIYRQLVSLATSDITDVIKVVLPGDQEYSDAIDQDAEQNDGQYGLPFGDPLVYVRPTDSLPSEVSISRKPTSAPRPSPSGLSCVEIMNRSCRARNLSRLPNPRCIVVYTRAAPFRSRGKSNPSRIWR